MSEDETPRIFGVPVPPEIIESIERHRALHEMANEDLKHSLYNFISDLTLEQVQILDLIILKCANSEGLAAQLSGYIDGLIESKFGICPACGKTKAEHDPEALLPPLDDAASRLEDKIERTITPLMREQMNEYGLDDLWDIEREVLLGFTCTKTEKSPYTGCGMRYQSVTDRMLRPPGIDGCSGCQLKSAHG